MALAVLGLVLPSFTTSTSGPTFSTEQEIFLVVVSVSLYGIFHLIQPMRHSQYFMESKDVAVATKFGHYQLEVRSPGVHAVLLLLYLLAVVLLLERFAIQFVNSIYQFALQQALGD